MPGFPSYCAGSLLIIASSITSCRCPRTGRRDISHACPDSPPNQVCLCYGPSTSYHFLQTPPFADDALVNRILFPVDGARPLALASDWVCQLRWANKRPRQRKPPGHYGAFTRPGLAIPCWVAPQQSPTPLHQSTIRIPQDAWRAKLQNPPNAPTGSRHN